MLQIQLQNMFVDIGQVDTAAPLSDSLWLTPNLISNLSHQRKLLLLLLKSQRISRLVRTKSTLRADTNPLQRFLTSLTGPLGNPVRRVQDSLLHLLLVLKLGKLGADHADYHILVLG